LVVAWSGCARSWRKPSASPSSSSSLRLWTHRSKFASFGATIEETMASSELSIIGLMLPALWIFSEVPVVPKQERKALTSEAGVGASPTIASRTPCPCRPATCSGAMP
jgi:hypothetical protein